MAKVRIYDLSKIVGISNKELVEYLLAVKDIPIKSHSSSVDQPTANEILVEFRRMKRAGKSWQDVINQKIEEKKIREAEEKARKKVEAEKKRLEKEAAEARQAEEEKAEKPEAKPVPQKQPVETAKPAPAEKVEQPEIKKEPPRQKKFERPQEDRRPPRMERPAPQGERQAPRGDRPPVHRSDRPAPRSDRPAPRGDRPAPRGDRPPFARGDRPAPRGDRPAPRGDRPAHSGDRPPFARGDRPAPRSDRPAPQGDRPPFKKPGARPDQTSQRPRGRGGKPGEIEIPSVAPEVLKQKPKRRRKKKPGVEAAATTGAPERTTTDEALRPRKEGIRQFTGTRTKTFPLKPLGRRKDRRKKGPSRPPEVTKKESTIKWMEVPESITIGDLARKLDIQANELIKLLMKQGIMASMNQSLQFDMAAQLVKNFGFRVERQKEEEVKAEDEVDDPRLLSPRPPVVTVLGHVDHGKTSLLDCIRKTDVAATESGGITQSIGAYTVDLGTRRIVFLDTPGHEAFTAMRARGAKVTDIAVLVVAADDGVMPQTVEAINHAKAAGVPIIVAINKVDKPEANPEKVKQQLAEFDLISEDWGGDVVTVPVSAKSKVGIEDLLEMILLVADVQELKANPRRLAQGVIIESFMNTGLGPVATVVVQNGTLKVGDVVTVGNEWGRVKVMLNDKGRRVRKVLPSMPAEIIGLSGVPEAGDHLQVVEDEKDAKETSERRKEKLRTERMEALVPRTSLDDLFRQMKEGEVKDLNIVLKADVQGSVEALRHSLLRLSNVEVNINIIHGGVGAVNRTDVMLARASNAIIIGFNVRPDPIAEKLAEQEVVDVRLYRVIYHVIEDIKAAMLGLLEPEYEEVLMGRAQVRATFKISKIGVIAGCYVIDGKITRGAKARVVRDGVVIYEGKIDSLRRFKEDVREVETNFECGIGIDKFGGLQPDDIIEAFTLQEVKKELPLPVEQEAAPR